MPCQADTGTLERRGHGARVRAMAWLPDDSRLLSAGAEGAVYEWRLSDLRRTREHTVKVSPTRLRSHPVVSKSVHWRLGLPCAVSMHAVGEQGDWTVAQSEGGDC